MTRPVSCRTRDDQHALQLVTAPATCPSKSTPMTRGTPIANQQHEHALHVAVEPSRSGFQRVPAEHLVMWGPVKGGESVGSCGPAIQEKLQCQPCHKLT